MICNISKLIIMDQDDHDRDTCDHDTAKKTTIHAAKEIKSLIIDANWNCVQAHYNVSLLIA